METIGPSSSASSSSAAANPRHAIGNLTQPTPDRPQSLTNTRSDFRNGCCYHPHHRRMYLPPETMSQLRPGGEIGARRTRTAWADGVNSEELQSADCDGKQMLRRRLVLDLGIGFGEC
ncbi:hypothetical protein LIA77_10033 [Sarocladium implicatum]|nr:hypothetical protein LIA77_10033 [Sarocladium implicatum]